MGQASEMESWTGPMPSWRKAITLLGTQTCSKRVDSMRAVADAAGLWGAAREDRTIIHHIRPTTLGRTAMLSRYTQTLKLPHHWHDSALTRDSHPFNAVMSR